MAFFQRPSEGRGALQKIATGLQAFGAGVQGRGPEFLALQQRQEQALSEDRQRAAAEDIRRAKLLFDQGDIEGVRALASERAAMINQLGGDPSDTNAIQNLAIGALQGDSGAFQQLGNELNLGMQAAVERGFIQAPEQVQPLSPEGRLAVDRARGFVSGDDVSAARDIEERRVAVSEMAEERQARKLSASAEKLLISSQDSTRTLMRDANTFDNLADEFTRVEDAGIQARFSEGLKQFLGTEDDVTNLRRQYNAIRSSQAINNLPPGVASDKDIELALKGFPRDTANSEQIQSFLRGSAKVARADAAWNQFRADFISENRNTRNLGREWRKKINSPALDRDVTLGEVYITAQNRGITPEEVMQQLGL